MSGSRDTVRRMLLTAGLVVAAGGAVLQTAWHFAWAAEQRREDVRTTALLAQVAQPKNKAPAADPALRAPAAVLAAHPLSELPLLRAGLEAAAAGSGAPARALVNEAVRRDPRSVNGRSWLASDALRRGDRRGALRQLQPLLALRPQQADTLFPLMGALVQDPALRGEIGRMAKGSMWGGGFLSYLTRTSADPGLVFELTRGAVDARAAGATAQQSQVVQSLIDRGDYDRAYLSWISFLPNDALGATGLVYDSGFKGMPGPTPFNWRLISGDVANVLIEPATGLTIDYHGENAAQFAEQVVLLDPRSYRLSYTATGDPVGDAGKLVQIHLYCLPGRNVIAELNVTPGQPGAADVTVPATSCPAQLLAIDGTPGEFPAQRQVILRQLTLTPTGAVQ